MLNRTQKLKTLLFFVCLLVISVLPLLISQICFVQDNVSKNDALVHLVFPALSIFLMFFLPIYFGKLMPQLAGFDLTLEKKPYTKIRWILLLTVIAFLSSIITGVASKYTGLLRMEFILYDDVSRLTLGFFIIQISLTVLFVPIAEEVFWRGYAQEQLGRCFGKWIALFLQAFLFALVHMRPLLGFVSVFFHGLIFGYWKQKKRRLIPIIIVHIIINGLFALTHYPGQYELSKVNIAVNYVEELNKIGNIRPTEDNAAPHYTKAVELLTRQPQDLPDIRKLCWITDLSSQEQTALNQWLQENNEAMSRIRLGTQKVFYWPHYSGASILEIQGPFEYMDAKLCDLGMALCWNAILKAAEGNINEATNELISGYRLGCHLTTGPKPTTEQFTGMALKRRTVTTAFMLIHKVDWSGEQLERFQTAFQELAEVRESTIDMRCEKMNLYDIIQRLFTDDGNGSGHIPKLELKEMRNSEMVKVLASGLTDDKIDSWAQLRRDETEKLVEKLFVFFENVILKSPVQLHKEGIDIGATVENMTGNNMINIYLTRFSTVHDIFYKNKVFEDALITTLGILRYKAEHDNLPKNLEVLVSQDYLYILPVDPYSGNALVYQKNDDNFILYSFGKDFDDDSGKHDNKWGKADGDYVFWPIQYSEDK